MNEKGRAPQERKVTLKQRFARAVVTAADNSQKRKQEKQAKKTPAPRANTAQRTPAPRTNTAQRTPQSRPASQRPQSRPASQRPQSSAPAQQGAQPQRASQRQPLTAEQRRERAEYMRKMKTRRRVSSIVIAVTVLLLIVLILSRTVLFKIETIELTNPEEADYTVSQIQSVCGVTPGTQNLFSCNLNKVARNIEQRLPYIGKAQVERDFPSTLRVTVTPTRATAAIAYGTGYLLIDADGKMLEQVETTPDGIPVLRCATDFELNLGQYIGVPLVGKKEDEQTQAAAAVMDLYKRLSAAAQEAKLDDVTLIDIRDVRAITLMYQNRLTLHLGSDEKLEQKLKTGVKIIAAESDASRTRTGAIDLTVVPFGYSRDTYETKPGEDTTDVTETESTTKAE